MMLKNIKYDNDYIKEWFEDTFIGKSASYVITNFTNNTLPLLDEDSGLRYDNIVDYIMKDPYDNGYIYESEDSLSNIFNENFYVSELLELAKSYPDIETAIDLQMVMVEDYLTSIMWDYDFDECYENLSSFEIAKLIIYRCTNDIGNITDENEKDFTRLLDKEYGVIKDNNVNM